MDSWPWPFVGVLLPPEAETIHKFRFITPKIVSFPPNAFGRYLSLGLHVISMHIFSSCLLLNIYVSSNLITDLDN